MTFGMFLYLIVIGGQSGTIIGEVIRVNEANIEIRTNTVESIPNGSRVELIYVTSGGMELKIGVWSVSQVDGQNITAIVTSADTKPRIGLKAIIYIEQSPVVTSLEPGSVNILAVTPVSPAVVSLNSNPKPTTQSTSSPSTHLPQAVSELATMLRSGSAVDKRIAAKRIYNTHLSNPKMLKTVNDELLKGYKLYPRDKHHIDAMSWLCNILGRAGQKQYLSTLYLVGNEARNKKLRKYALVNAKRLR